MSYLSSRLSLFRLPAFTCHAISCLTGTMGIGMTYLAMTWTVVNIHHSISSVAWLMTCFWLPGVLMAPITGVLVDRFLRKYIVFFSVFMRTVGLCILAYVYHQKPSISALYLFAVLSGIGSSLYTPAAMAFVREIVPSEKLLFANATIDMCYELGFMLGTQCGGYLLMTHTPVYVFLANALCFMLTLIATASIKRRWVSIEIGRMHRGFGRDIIDGLIYLKKKKALRFLYFIQLFIFMSLMTTPILLAPFAERVLHATAKEFGVIEAALSLGVVLGSLIMPLLAQRYTADQMLKFATGCMTVSFVCFAFCQTVAQAIGLYGLLGFCLSSWALITTKAQHATKLSYQGRMQSTFNALAGIGIVCVFFIVGSASAYLSVRTSYVFIVMISFTAFLLCSRL